MTPIVSTLDKLESLEQDADVAEYVTNVYGGVEQCRKDILRKFFMKKAYRDHPCLFVYFVDDLFRHGFDGSGGDNYFDAGSCIDGRLTSAWNCKYLYKFAITSIQVLTYFCDLRVFNY